MLISGHTAFLALESVDGKSLYFDPYYKPSPGAKTHTREGVVVRGDGNGKLYKMISNNYLFRKGEQTEFE